MKRILLIVALTGAALTASAQVFPYQDTRLSAEERARNLLTLLTLEEKASLCVNASPAIERLGIARYDWWNEALHGVARNGSATVFPQAIGMAASFDPELLLKVFTIASDEARVKHRLARESGEVGQYQGLTFWTPNINIFRDPRWGRGMETYGEDPYLTGQMGIMAVRGLQGDLDAPVLKTHACAKHFAVHSGLESNRHHFNADVSERDLRETYLPAFKDLVVKGQVQEVMTAYNRFRGKPCAASDYLVNDILRGEWGYKGLVVSDCWALPDFYEKGHHGFSDNATQAAALAVKTGVDVECGSTYVNIPEAVRSGLLDEAVLDRNVLRILIQRFRLGEMDGWSPWDKLDASTVESPEHRSVSRQMARESIVLLQNKGGILPLKTSKPIALIGPNADDAEMQWGNYNAIPKTTVTLKTALKARVPELVYLRGCGIMGADYAPEDGSLADSFLPQLKVQDILSRLDGIETVVFAGGISPRFEGEEMPVEVPGFSGGDRTEIDLPQVQRTLLKALHDAGKKVILVNFSGSAIGLEPETETCEAIVQAWYPGQEGGTAIADVLFGEIVPSGKLPVTFYASADDLPDVEDYNMEGHTYRFFRGKPVFAFGHGLSFVEFKYGRARIRDGQLVIPVKNTGRRPADEVVQLYVKKEDDEEGGPIKTLRGFKRVTIPAGKTVDVRFALTDEVFTWWNPETEVMEPMHGDYILYYGGSSDKTRDMDYTY